MYYREIIVRLVVVIAVVVVVVVVVVAAVNGRVVPEHEYRSYITISSLRPHREDSPIGTQTYRITYVLCVIYMSVSYV